MLSPLVVTDLLQGGGPALELLIEESAVAPAAVNLCTSSVNDGRLSDRQMDEAIERLLKDDGVLRRT